MPLKPPCLIVGVGDGVGPAFARAIAPDIQTLLDEDAILKPDAIARNHIWLHNPQRSTGTFELDLRPWKENR